MGIHPIFQFVLLFIALGLYFLPALLAKRRMRHDMLIIALFNALVGWTIFGWILALFWSLQPNPPKTLAGDVREKGKRVGMLNFSQRLADRVRGRDSRATDRERPSR